MIDDLSPNSDNEDAKQWLGLELFSVWRNSESKPHEIHGETIQQLLDVAADEGRTLNGRGVWDIAGEMSEGDLRQFVESLVKSSEQVPDSFFDLPALKRQGIRVDGDAIGRGAMGVVYQCWQYDANRNAAIKFIQVQGGDDVRAELTERLQEEARIVGPLKHKHICQVYLAGSVSDWSNQPLPFIVMELVEGGPLQEAYDTISPDLKTTMKRCELFRKICTAVNFAHSKGVFHRDIKPSNILLDGKDKEPDLQDPKLTDFGLAQWIDSTDCLVGASGTPGYRSPSVLRSLETNPARADLYSLGILLYRVLCGTEPDSLRPSDMKYLDSIENVNTRSIAEASQVEARLLAGLDLPESVAPKSRRRDLESIINRACGGGPYSSSKYSKTSELLDDVEHFIVGRTVTATDRNTKLLRTQRWAERNRAVVAALILGILLAIGAGSWYVKNKAQTSRLNMQRAEALIKAATTDRDLHQELTLAKHKFAEASKLFAAAGKRAQAENAGIGAAWLDRVELGTFFQHNGGVNGAAFDSAGKRLLTWGEDGIAVLWDPATERQIASFHHNGSINGAAWVGNGEMLATWSDDMTAKLWDTDGKLIRTLSHGGFVVGGVVDSTGTHLATWTSTDRTIKVWDTNQGGTDLGGQIGQPIACRGSIRDVKFTENGDRIVAWESDQTATVWEIDSGTAAFKFENAPDFNGPSIAADGSIIVTLGTSGPHASVWDARKFLSSNRTPTPESKIAELPHGDQLLGSSLNAASDTLLTWSRDGCAYVWNPKTGELLDKFSHFDSGKDTSFVKRTLQAIQSQFGDEFVTWSYPGLLKVWAKASDTPRCIIEQKEQLRAVKLIESSRLLLTVSEDNRGRVWDIDNGQCLATLCHNADVTGMTISGDKVCTWSDDGSARVWRLSNFGRQAVLLEHDSQSGRYFVFGSENDPLVLCTLGTTSEDRKLVLWDAVRNQKRETLKVPCRVRDVDMSKDRTIVAFAGSDGTMRVHDRNSSQRWELHLESDIENIELVDGDTQLLATSRNGDVTLWPFLSGNATSFQAPVSGASSVHAGFVTSNEYKHVLAWRFGGDAVSIWRLGHPPSTRIDLNVPEKLMSVSWHDDRIFTCTTSGCAKVWDLSGTLIHTLQHKGPVVGAFLEPAKQFIVTYSDDTYVKTWDVKSGNQISEFPCSSVVKHCAINEAGTRLLTISGDRIAGLWSTEGQLLRSFDIGDAIWSEFLSDDLVCTYSRHGFSLVDVNTEEILASGASYYRPSFQSKYGILSIRNVTDHKIAVVFERSPILSGNEIFARPPFQEPIASGTTLNANGEIKCLDQAVWRQRLHERTQDP